VSSCISFVCLSYILKIAIVSHNSLEIPGCRNSAQQFDDVATQYQTLKATYEMKRDVMANDETLAAILGDAGKKRQSLLKSVKSIVKGKTARQHWSPHVEHYQTDPKAEFGDAMDTLAKAGQDLTKLEQEMRGHTEDPKRLTAVIQEYQDLILKTNEVVEQTSPRIAACQSEWATFVEAIE
jgi:outer membrane murein-binding lipoprotein Lpp